MYRIQPTGRFLFLHKIIDSLLCAVKKKSHLICGCMKSKSFKNNHQCFVKEKCANILNLQFTEHFLFFAVLQTVFMEKVWDLIVLFAKFYACKWQETAPSLNTFLGILKDRFTVEKIHIYTSLQTDHIILYLEWLPYKALILTTFKPY